MSASVSRDPLVVNTQDGAVWVRRAVTGEGRGLYAVDGSCNCPEYLMATLAELAEHGIVGSADVLPTRVGPERSPLERALDDLAGANLSLWEEERAYERLRVALESAKRGRRQLRARIAELEAAAKKRRNPGACESCGAVPEAWCPDCAACEKGCFGGFDGNDCTHANAPWGRRSADALTQAFAPVASLREDPHDSPLHHSYRVGRDLPETGGAR